MSDQNDFSIRTFAAVWGLLAGIFVLLVWRFVAPPHYGGFSVSAPEGGGWERLKFSISMSDSAFIPYVPAWITFPVVGLVSGLLIGTGLRRLGVRIASDGERRTAALSWLLCGALGIVTGLAAAATLEWSPPTVFIGPEVAERTGAPPQLGFPFLWLTLPLFGLIVGLGIAAVLRWGGATLVQSLPVRARYRDHSSP
jgi:hypothetical protein